MTIGNGDERTEPDPDEKVVVDETDGGDWWPKGEDKDASVDEDVDDEEVPLREKPLSEMTEEEKEEFARRYGGDDSE